MSGVGKRLRAADREPERDWSLVRPTSSVETGRQLWLRWAEVDHRCVPGRASRRAATASYRVLLSLPLFASLGFTHGGPNVLWCFLVIEASLTQHSAFSSCH